jgi:flagellar motility protein MotE (MotC chaperone)
MAETPRGEVNSLKEMGAERRRGRGRGMAGSFFWLIVLLVVIVAGFWWFDRINLFDYRSFIYPFLSKVPWLGSFFAPAPSELLTERGRVGEELDKQREAIELAERDLIKKEMELSQKEAELKKREEELEARLQEVALAQKALSEERAKHDNLEKNLQEIAELFASLPPENAVERLEKLDDLQLIDVLRKMEEIGRSRNVVRMLSLMDAERASVIARKMLRSRTSLEGRLQVPVPQGP